MNIYNSLGQTTLKNDFRILIFIYPPAIESRKISLRWGGFYRVELPHEILEKLVCMYFYKAVDYG